MKPTEEQALQFAIMLAAGLPAAEAICYFVETDDPAEMAMVLRNWTRSTALKAAVGRLERKPWTEMTLPERMEAALNQHYNSLAYLLKSVNYIEASSTDKQKLDTARGALEAKLAGTAGATSPIDQFFADLNAGKLHLNKATAGSLGSAH
jgi:hypothetical protein